MTEVLLENLDDTDSDDQQNPISVLLLATKWQFDTYGLSTVNKSLVNNLRVVDPEGKKIKITCAVVEEDRKIQSDQREDAAKCNVELRGGKQPRGSKKKPCLEWLDQNIAAYYPDLLKNNSYNFIIGHAPYLANGPLNIRSLYHETEAQPKVILMIHDLPRSTDGDTDKETLVEWLSDADIVFSVGNSVKSEIVSFLASVPSEQQPVHQLYIPGFPLELFNVCRRKLDGNKVQGIQNITLMTKECKDLEISGINFPLAVTSIAAASKYILDSNGVETNFVLLTENREDKDQWKKEFEEILKIEETRGQTLQFHVDSQEDVEKMKVHMRESNLMILPLKPGTPALDCAALSAIAAAVLILVSNYPGISSLPDCVCQHEYNIHESKLDFESEKWTDIIIQKILRPEDSQLKATKLREQLLLDTSIAQTHLDFIKTIVGASSVSVKVEVHDDSAVDQEHIDLAKRFGIDLGDPTSPVEAKKYVVAFLQKIFMQREKIDHGHLTDYLQSGICTQWKEVLSRLESSERKLLDIGSGSLVFTLFCPTISSTRELTNESWIRTLTVNMEQFVKEIGVEPQLRINPPVDVANLLSRLQQMKLCRTTQSEGYDTISHHSSEIVSEIFEQRRKVMNWLTQQPESKSQPVADPSEVALRETMVVNHIALDSAGNSSSMKFSLSKLSGSVGIASIEGKPTLSVVCPGTDKPHRILSKDNRYRSVIFMTISNQEYLVAASRNSIRLWNMDTNISSIAYKLSEGNDWHLCVIDERTVVCVPEQTSSEDSNKIYMLNTDTEKFTLSDTIQVKSSQQISDMCHVKATDGTPCLLLSFPWENLAQSMEMSGREVRWQVDEQQIGAAFLPWSICTDGNTVFILNVFDYKLHLLSVEDGSVLSPISLYPFGIDVPCCVCLQDEHLYVGHMNKDGDTYCVSKFTKPAVV